VPVGNQSGIPYTRVNHNKYMVTDKAAYIGEWPIVFRIIIPHIYCRGQTCVWSRFVVLEMVNNWPDNIVLSLRYLQLVRGLLSEHSWSGSGDFPARSSSCMEDQGPAGSAEGSLWQGLVLWVCCVPFWPGAPPRLCIIKLKETSL